MKYQFDEAKHIHLIDGQPAFGTSTVIKEVMPPFLAKWGAQCAVDHIQSASNSEVFKLEDLPQILTEAVSAWSKVRDKAATKGTDMHAELEKYVNRMLTDFDGKPQLLNNSVEKDEAFEKIQRFAVWAVDNIDTFIFTEKCTYSKSLWVGGVVDCLAKMKDGALAVVDFKSSKEAYFNQFAQCAGYALQLEESGYGNADGSDWQILPAKITKLIIIPFGAKTLFPEIIENVEGYKEVFTHLVKVYEFLRSFKA